MRYHQSVRLTRILLTTMAVTFGALIVYFGLTNARAWLSSNNYERETNVYEQQLEYRNLFEVAAGNVEPSSIGPERELAIALERIIEANEGDELATRSALERFDGPPGVYRSIAEVLGVNPFQGTSNCKECGSLEPETINNLIAVEFDGTSVPVGDKPVEPGRVSLTPLGSLLEFLLVWQVSAGVGAMLGMRLFGDPKMIWSLGDGRHDGLEYSIIAAAPVYMAYYLIRHNRQNALEHERERESWLMAHGFTEPLRLIEAQLKRIGAMNDNVRLNPSIVARRNELESFKQVIEDEYDNHWARQEGLLGEQVEEETKTVLTKIQEGYDLAVNTVEQVEDELSRLT